MMAERLTAAQRRYNENALLISAMGLIFKRLSDQYMPRLLGDIADTTSGGTPLRAISTYYGGEIPWIKSGELNDGIIVDAEEHITHEGLENSSAKIFPKETLVVALYGATVGKTGILGLDAASNQAVCAIFPKSDIVSTRFLFWFLRYKRPEFLSDSFGGAQPNISQRLLRITEVPVPPKNIQDVICDFLQIVERRQNGDRNADYPFLPDGFADTIRIVARIEALAARIAEAQSLRRDAEEEAELLAFATARKIFSALDSPIIELGELVDKSRNGIQTGPFGAQLGSGDFLDNGHPVITIGNVQYSGLELDKLKFISAEKSQQLSRFFVQTGDILFARMGTVGRCCVVPEEAEGWVFNYHLIRVALDKSRIEPRYIHWLIRASQDIENKLADKIRGATREGVNSKIVASLPCRIPPLDEQRRIVAYLDSLQAQVSALRALQESTRRELESLLPSVLDRAFKGEL